MGVLREGVNGTNCLARLLHDDRTESIVALVGEEEALAVCHITVLVDVNKISIKRDSAGCILVERLSVWA